MASINMVKALNLALAEAMREDENVTLLGEDIGIDGGVFRVTEGLLQEFGSDRVIDTPVAEAGIVGAAIGMSLYGLRPVCEMQFSGFAYQSFHQIEGHLSRYRARSRSRFTVPMVIRMPYGGGIRAIEHHSESREAIYAHTPGLQVVIPSTPRNARSLLRASMQSDDPVIFYEPKSLYRAFREEVPDEPETLPIGKANVVREGSDVTLIGYGAMVRVLQEAAEDLHDQDGVGAEVIDLLSIAPMDTETMVASVAKTGRVIIVHEGPRRCGVGAEVAARLAESALDHLEAPVRRLTGFDVQFPYFARERAYLPNSDRVIQAVRELLAY
ncbi:MAG: alpha-ketoacid dehydrogenase subunit beta [Planctomycetes bacterium]|nr:alpha-ketoacid dehydrogenase subunit beta [Planctomycetota bacterium]